MFTKATSSILTIKKIVALLAFLFAINCSAQWTQQQACPGWSNPANFNAWANGQLGAGGYSGSGGIKNNNSCPNVLTGETGTQSLTPAYTAAQMNTVTASGCSYPSLAIPDQYRQFAIMTNLTGTDPNTANHLKYVPTQFNYIDTTGRPSTNISRSIRIGDGATDCNPNTYDVSLLNYQMRVTSQNAMLFLYYAIVAQAPTHGQSGNQTFIIRVMRRDNTRQWKQISDTMAYYVTSTSDVLPQSSASSATCPGMVNAHVENDLNVNGWHKVNVSGISSGNDILYKDWDKVAINLSNYIYDTVQVQVLIHDCVAEFHFAYAYIAGECRPLELRSESSTITAPTDLLAYEWAASEYGASDFISRLNPGNDNDYFTFRTLTTASGQPANTAEYQVKRDDFRILYRPNANKIPNIAASPDSIGAMQTFRCRMTTAIDPAKPYYSDLYLNVSRSVLPFTVTATVNDSAMGSTIGGGQFDYGEMATVGALPKQGFGFNGWDDGSSDNPYTLTVTRDTVITALLEPIINIVDTIIINNYIHDTITIHDTVFVGGNEGIDGMVLTNAKIFQRNGNIVIEGAAGELVTVYDEVGRTVAVKKDNSNCTIIEAPTSGIYHIKIGTNTPKRIVLIKN